MGISVFINVQLHDHTAVLILHSKLINNDRSDLKGYKEDNKLYNNLYGKEFKANNRVLFALIG